MTLLCKLAFGTACISAILSWLSSTSEPLSPIVPDKNLLATSCSALYFSIPPASSTASEVAKFAPPSAQDWCNLHRITDHALHTCGAFRGRSPPLKPFASASEANVHPGSVRNRKRWLPELVLLDPISVAPATGRLGLCKGS
jgi:hypothetical protein